MKDRTPVMRIAVVLIAVVLFFGVAANLSMHEERRLGDFTYQIAAGNINGYSFINKFGRNPDVDSNDPPEDIWNCVGLNGAPSLYPFPSAPVTVYASSTNAGDAQNVKVFGLGADWEAKEETITLAGQTAVQLSGTWRRVHRMFNKSVGALAGDVYVGTDSNPVGGSPDVASENLACIAQGDDQSFMAVYTVPLGYTGYMMQGCFSVVADNPSQAKSAEIAIRIREEDEAFRTIEELSVQTDGTSTFCHDMAVPLVFPQKCDMVAQVMSVGGNNTGVAATFAIVLRPNE